MKKLKSNNSFFTRVAGMLLAMLFFVFSSGLAVNIHYCGDEISSVKVLGLSADCGCGDSQDSCCKDEFKIFKVKDSYSKAPVVLKAENVFKMIALVSNSFDFNHSVTFLEILPGKAFSPPDYHNPPIYLLIRRLSI